MSWFKAAPGIWHVLDKIVENPNNKNICLAICGRVWLFDAPTEDDPPEKSMICIKCKKMHEDQ